VKNRLLFAFIGIVLVASCTRISTTEIGTGLIPPVDGVNTFDTVIEVSTENFVSDSMRVSVDMEHALGYITNDPLFGTTKAILNTELKPPYFPYYYEVPKDSLFLDSVVLVLSYKGIWGDTTNSIHLNVFEIAQSNQMKADSIYPTYASFNTASQIGGTTIADPRRLVDSVYPFNEAATKQIRIKLNNTFGDRLLKTFDSTNAYQTDSAFRTYFAGFSVIPDAGPNTLLRVALPDTNTKLALYYRYLNRTGPAGNLDTAVRYFRVTNTCATSNNIVRTRTGAEVNNFLTNTGPDSLIYLQTSPGTFVRIKTPNLTGLSNRLVHRAELLMEEQAGAAATDGIFTEPNLFLSAYSNDSSRRFNIPYDITYAVDGTVSNLNTFGGFVVYKNDNAGNRVASYNFNISRYVQSICTRQDKVYDLILSAPVYDYIYPTETSSIMYPVSSSLFNPVATGRVRLLGGNSLQKDRKMRIRIIYSKVP